MQQLTMLVTADGRWVLPGSEEFLAALGDPNPDYDAVGFAVRNLGFIKFQVLDRIVTEIELHPRNIDLRALLALEKQLGEVGTKLFRIKYLDSEWRSEITASVEHTVARLRELCAPAFEPPVSERFRVEPQDPALLKRGAAENAAALLEKKWRVSFGHFDPSVLSLAFEHRLMAHLAIVGINLDGDEPVFRYIGDIHANWLQRQYHLRAVGEKVENIPDKEYGHWVAKFYKSVARSGQPRYDHITAMIKTGPQPYVTHYERLLLPWKTSSSDVVVTAFSRRLPDQSDDSAAGGAPSSVLKNAAKSS